MTEQTISIEQILEELSPKVRYRTIGRIFGATYTIGGVVQQEEIEQIKQSIPTSMLIEALRNAPHAKPGVIDEDFFFEHSVIENIAKGECFERDDVDLILAGAERLEEKAEANNDPKYFSRAGSLYAKVDSEQYIEKAATCFERAARIYRGFDDREAVNMFSNAANNYEKIGNYKKVVACLDPAAYLSQELERGRYLDRIVGITEKYDVKGAIKLALTENQKGWAVTISARHGRYDEAIALAEDDNSLKAKIAEQLGHYSDAAKFYEATADEIFRQAVEYLNKQGISIEDENTLLFIEAHPVLLEAARNARKAGLKTVEDRLYTGLVQTYIKAGNLRTAEDTAFEAERWEDFANIRLMQNDEEFADVYHSILDGSYVGERELLEDVLKESVNNGVFRVAALVATHLGMEKQSSDFMYLGRIMAD